MFFFPNLFQTPIGILVGFVHHNYDSFNEFNLMNERMKRLFCLKYFQYVFAKE